jgi:NAD(P)-dependent dehydrogenase (short-subunit alcohol dehydrogenase family)
MKPRSSDGQFMRSPWRRLSSSFSFKGLASSRGLQSPCAIQNFTAGLAQLLAEKGIRANAVAPGPIWTPFILSTMTKEAVENFGQQVPMKRPATPQSWRRPM